MLRQTIAELIVLFFCYSVAGWCMEVILKYIQFHRFINRGFLIGPYCPIYGSGAVVVTVLVGGLIGNASYIVTFLASFVLCGVLEYFVSWYMEKIVPCALVGLQPKANESAWPYLDWKLGIIWNWRCGNCKADRSSFDEMDSCHSAVDSLYAVRCNCYADDLG